ncbi:MAG: hypothetical protein KF734_13315 [Saprospiraceae bacterium]|nr:hypothetical protein [Saprospiraceae bacterium]
MRVVLIFIVLFMYCCKQSKAAFQAVTPLERSNECESLYQYFKANWVKHESGFYGFQGDSVEMKQIFPVFNKLRNRCFVGFTRKEMYSLLGEPSLAYVSNDSLARVEYHFNENCRKIESGCLRIKIRIDPRADTVFRVLPLITERVDY